MINLRFPGQYHDSETGFEYNWNRYYDPAVGRYVSSDPIGIVAARNTYVYVSDNPLLYVDLSGLVKRIKYDIQVFETTGGVNISGRDFSANFEQKGHWIIYVNVPDCFVRLSKRERRFDLNHPVTAGPGIGHDERGIHVEGQIYSGFVDEWVYTYGPKPGDHCCKGTETWDGYTYYGGPNGWLGWLSRMLDLLQ